MTKIKKKEKGYNRLMNILKISLILPLLYLFLSINSLSVKAEVLKDCSQVKKLHKKLICQMGGGKSDSEQAKRSEKRINKLLKPTLADYFKKEE